MKLAELQRSLRKGEKIYAKNKHGFGWRRVTAARRIAGIPWLYLWDQSKKETDSDCRTKEIFDGQTLCIDP